VCVNPFTPRESKSFRKKRFQNIQGVVSRSQISYWNKAASKHT